jgi:RecA/RadA recombinase
MRFSTGMPLLDDALGGGIPVGLSEIFGEDNSGKTCLALSILREAAINGEITGFVNAENRADPNFIDKLTGGLSIHVVPKNGEAAIEAAYSLIMRGVKVVCIDTTDALVPAAEDSLLVGNRIRLGQKRLVFHGYSMLREASKRRGAAVIVTSQVRVNPNEFRPKKKSSFHVVTSKLAGCRIGLSKGSETSAYGTRHFTTIRASIEKNAGRPPLSEEILYLWSGKGFSRSFELFRALASKKLKRRGAYWKNDSVTLGPGYASATDQVRENYNYYRGLLDE